MSNAVVHRFGRLPLHRGTRVSAGFTLLELLIVVGVIVLLATILLTVVSKAREAGRRTTCLSNLGNIAHAIMAYASDNDGTLPAAAAATPGTPPNSDWIWWQSSRIDQIGQGGAGFYLKLSNDPHDLSVMRCPGDDLTSVSMVPGGRLYLFSYVLNAMMSSGNNIPGALPSGIFPARTMRQVKDESQKILVYEEDSRIIDDGNGALLPNATDITKTELLSIRHDVITMAHDDPSMAVSIPLVPRVPNPGAMGNVAFCDGHAGPISRADAHSRLHFAPDSNSPPWPPNNAIP
jgi:prepilin-type N-terminal cleavage/methylation domain-containing protein/prepilin-type processing-associated H-X9-DG protein